MNKDIICPHCQQKTVHQCVVLQNMHDKDKFTVNYHCNTCGADWVNSEDKEETKPECFWCNHYKTVLKEENIQKSSFILLVNPAGTGLAPGIDPIYCPFCGKKMIYEEEISHE